MQHCAVHTLDVHTLVTCQIFSTLPGLEPQEADKQQCTRPSAVYVVGIEYCGILRADTTAC